MGEHTPGPWYASAPEHPGTNQENDRLIHTEDNLHIAEVFQFMSKAEPIGPSLANAKLIAAAPKLLDACKAQHLAIDLLFAMLIDQSPRDNLFYPSKSGQPWEACKQGHEAIIEAGSSL